MPARLRRDPERHRPTDWLVGDATRLSEATGWKPGKTIGEIMKELLEYWRATFRNDKANAIS